MSESGVLCKINSLSDFKIILKIQLVENKEVTLLVELNW